MKYRQHFMERGYHSALMTTFSFDPITFENVMLVSLAHYGTRNIGIICDTVMFNRSINDMGLPSLVGRSYHVAKKSMPKGSFHPKIVMQLGRTEGRILIGSSNLTAAGMSGNLEACSLLRYNQENQYTSGIFRAVFDYIEAHSDPRDEAMAGVLERALRHTPWLRKAHADPEARMENGERLRLIVEGPMPVARQLSDFIGGDQIKRIVVLSPFQDPNLSGITKLRELLGAEDVLLIPDLKEQDFGTEAANAYEWLRLQSPQPLGVENDRRLHAKIIIALGLEADYVLTGSANATRSGIWGNPDAGFNAEAGIIRSFQAGTAIRLMQLPLDEAMMTTFPQDKMKRRPSSSPDRAGGTRPVDGGSIEFRQGVMRWRPPSAAFEATTITFRDVQGLPVHEVAAECVRDIWGEIPEAWSESLKDLRSATISRSSGGETAPIPIAFLNEISRNARPGQSRSIARILDDLEACEDIEDLFDRIAQLASFSLDEMKTAQTKRRKRSSAQIQKPRGQDDEDLGSRDEFLLDDDDIDEQGNSMERAAQIRSARSALDKIMGRMMQRSLSSDEEISALGADVSSLEERTSDTDEDIDAAGPEGDSSSADSFNKNAAGDQYPEVPGALQSSRGRRSAGAGVVEVLVQHEANLRTIIDLRAGQSELPSDHAITFEATVIGTMSAAAFGNVTAKRPLPPISNDPHGGWVRILARCVNAHCLHWADDDLLSQDLEDDQISSLATLWVAAEILLPMLDRYKMPAPSVINPLHKAAVGYYRKIQKNLAPHTPARIVFDQRVRQLRAHSAVKRMSSEPRDESTAAE